VFARIFAEPLIQRAIEYETGRDAAQEALDRAGGRRPRGRPRHIQPRGAAQRRDRCRNDRVRGRDGGPGRGRLRRVSRPNRSGPARRLALLVAAGGFLTVFLVPFAKYPANPPAIGHAETIRDRGTLFLVVLLVGVVAAVLAVVVGQRLAERFGSWNATVLAGAGYLAVLAFLFAVLPSLGHLHANVVQYGRHAPRHRCRWRTPPAGSCSRAFRPTCSRSSGSTRWPRS